LAQVLMGLYDQRERVLQIIYQITGLSDIVRGASKASETATAQELKGRYANVRIGPRQRCIAKFARDMFRLMAEIISEKFEAETLKLMTGPDLWVVEMPNPQTGEKQKVDATSQIMEMLRSDRLRGFNVDVETDSTIQPDASEEQKNRIEFLSAVSGFVTGIAPAVQSGAIPRDVALEFLSFGARGFKMSPQLEDAIDRIGSGSEGENAMKQKIEAQFAEREQQMKMGAQQLEQFKGVLQAESESVNAEKAKLEGIKAALEKQVIQLKHDREMAAKDAVIVELRQQDRKNTEGPQTVVQLNSDDQLGKLQQQINEGQSEAAQVVAGAVQSLHGVTQMMIDAVNKMNTPKRKIPKRDENGRIEYVDEVEVAS